MNHTRASKVMELGLVEPSSLRPCPVSGDGVDDSSDDHGEDHVAIEVASLRNSSRHDGGTGGGKCAL